MAKVNVEDTLNNTENSSSSSQQILTGLIDSSKQLYPSDEEEEDEALSHNVIMERFRDGLAEIILGDPLLNDLPTQVTEEEIQSQIALEYGQAMTVNVMRNDGINMPIVVIQSATVLDLKNAIKRYMTLKLERDGIKKAISWRYIWKTYWLYFEGQKLSEDQKQLKEYGIRNKDQVTFIKRLRQN